MRERVREKDRQTDWQRDRDRNQQRQRNRDSEREREVCIGVYIVTQTYSDKVYIAIENTDNEHNSQREESGEGGRGTFVLVKLDTSVFWLGIHGWLKRYAQWTKIQTMKCAHRERQSGKEEGRERQRGGESSLCRRRCWLSVRSFDLGALESLPK